MAALLEHWQSPTETEEETPSPSLPTLTNKFAFQLAPCLAPQSFVKDIAQASAATRKLMAFDKGTTTLAFRFKGGIMVACDSRASQGKH